MYFNIRRKLFFSRSVVYNSVTMDCKTPGFPILHHLLELAQTPIHWVSDAIQPSHPLSSPSPLAFNLSQNQGLFQWVSSSHQVSKELEFQLQHQSFQWIFRTDFLQDWLVWSPCCQGTLKSLLKDCSLKVSILFNGWVISHCIYVPHLLYPFTCQWTFRLLPWENCNTKRHTHP